MVVTCSPLCLPPVSLQHPYWRRSRLDRTQFGSYRTPARRLDFAQFRGLSLQTRMETMNPLVTSVATLAVSTIYIVWNNYRHFIVRRQKVLHERVAYMLWMAAMRDETDVAA